MNTEIARFNMIEQQIRPWEVLDGAVLALLATVKREDFVPAAMRSRAFMDVQIPLLPGGASDGGTCMLEPKIDARLLQELDVQRHERVLEIGTGSGYMAALLAHRAMQVTTLECHPVLAETARAKLRAAGLTHVTVVQLAASEGAKGQPSGAPYDVILLSGSVAQVPRALLEELSIGGRLAAIVGDEPVMVARLFTRVGAEAWSERDLFETVAPRLQGFAEPTRFRF